jgi:hypothetical protein
MDQPNDINKNNNINSQPTNKVPIKEDYKEYYEIEKNKDYIISKFGGTKRTVLSTVISSLYTLVFLILFIYYTEKHYDEGKDFNFGDCNRLKRWNRVIYIGLAVSFVFFIVCTILQIINKEKEKYIAILLLIRTVFNYIVGLFFLISITVVYFGIDEIDKCPPVRRVDLAYIICEWIIFSVCIIFHYIIVFFFLCCKAKRTFWNGEGDVDPEEMKKVI